MNQATLFKLNIIQNVFTAYNKTTFNTRKIYFVPCSKHLNYFYRSQARGKNLFPPHELGGKTVKMLLAVAKSDSYDRNENSY